MSRTRRKNQVATITPKPQASLPIPCFKVPVGFREIWQSRKLQLGILCLGLIGATLLVYGRTATFNFVEMDDPYLVYQNPHVNGGFTPGLVGWAFRETKLFYWQPLTWLSHALDCQLFGLKPGGHHLMNAGIHALNSVVLFLLMLYLTGHFWRSALVAALFSLHPLRVESVAWIAERRDVLCGLFSLLTLLAYARFAQRPASRGRYLVVVAAFWLALMSKPMAVGIPLLLLVIDFWPLQRWTKGTARRLLLEKVPLLVSAAAVAAITAFGNFAAGNTLSLAMLPFRERIVNAAGAYAAYLGKLVWPHGLAHLYPYKIPGAPALVLSGIILVVISGAAVRNVMRRPYLLAGWLWFVILLMPVSGLVQVGGQSMADRFTYLPLIGPTISIVWLLAEWLAKRPARKTAVISAAICVMGLLGLVSWRQTGYWKDELTLDLHTLAVTDSNERIWYDYGGALSRRGNFPEAANALQQAIGLNPGGQDQYKTLAREYKGLAGVLVSAGRPDEAIRAYRKVLAYDPDESTVLQPLIFLLIQRGAMEEAAGYVQAALQRAPGDAALKHLLDMATAGRPPGSPSPIPRVETPPAEPQPKTEAGLNRALRLSSDEALQLGILLGFCGMAILWPDWGKRGFRWFESALAGVAQRPARAMAVAALVPMALRLVMLPIYGVPEPLVHDEFGYLLLADTFAAGRLANPPHPMHDHLEAIYVLQNPSYASYYPPAQGLLLAAAKVVGVSPWLAVWLSVGAMCACFYWMLAGWMPARWALLGALLAGARFGVLSQWMNSYWGGALTAIGGALVFGALPRIFREMRVGHVAVLGLGIAILAQSRPYEGLLVSIPVAVVLGIRFFSAKGVSYGARLTRFVLPLAAILACVAGFTAYYNWRVTGNPVQLPYQLYQKQYGVPQSFYWRPPLPPGNSVRFADEEALYRWQLEQHNAGQSWKSLAVATGAKLRSLWGFYVQPVWTLPLFALPWIWRSRRLRWLLIALAFVIGGIAMYPFFFPHYLAPAAGILLLITVEGIRRMRVWQWKGRKIGAALAGGVLAASLTNLVIAPASEMAARTVVSTGLARGRIQKVLNERADKHLILVRYSPEHSFQYSVVYNDANIDDAHVVWARDLGAAKNQELVRYFQDRTVWTFDADKSPVRLVPYQAARTSAAVAVRLMVDKPRHSPVRVSRRGPKLTG